MSYGDNGLLENSILNGNLLQTFKKHTHAKESHIVLVLGLSEVPCHPWLYSLAPLLQLLDYASLLLLLSSFTHSLYRGHVLSLGAVLCISSSKALPADVWI